MLPVFSSAIHGRLSSFVAFYHFNIPALFVMLDSNKEDECRQFRLKIQSICFMRWCCAHWLTISVISQEGGEAQKVWVCRWHWWHTSFCSYNTCWPQVGLHQMEQDHNPPKGNRRFFKDNSFPRIHITGQWSWISERSSWTTCSQKVQFIRFLIH